MTDQSEFEWSDGISIVIPTYKRPEGLARALPSVAQERLADHRVEIVIADNDPAASARDYVEAFAQTSALPITYIHVPEPGVSNARNGALSVAKGRWIAFLDDDMEALPDWLEPLMRIAETYDAGMVFGPVNAVMPENGPPTYKFIQPLFSRNLDQGDGLIENGIATGNCLLDRGCGCLPSPIFNPAFNQSGGEDDALFNHLIQHGIKAAWASQAKTNEYVPTHRATLSYVWRRNFAWGQSPSQDAARMGIRGVFSVLFWMAVGGAQTIAYGLGSLTLRLLGRPSWVGWFGRMAQGVGKVFWMNRFSPKLYGI